MTRKLQRELWRKSREEWPTAQWETRSIDNGQTYRIRLYVDGETTTITNPDKLYAMQRCVALMKEVKCAP